MPNLLAKRLRRNPTDAERRLWHALRDRRFEHLKFRRQQPMGRYVVDFICHERRLIVEVDGSQHSEEGDAERTAFLIGEGYRVRRFWNTEVLLDLESVLTAILAAADDPSYDHRLGQTPHPPIR